jgi:hypothetical protein
MVSQQIQLLPQQQQLCLKLQLQATDIKISQHTSHNTSNNTSHNNSSTMSGGSGSGSR